MTPSALRKQVNYYKDSRDNLKKRAQEKRKQFQRLLKRIDDLEESREGWKSKYYNLLNEIEGKEKKIQTSKK